MTDHEQMMISAERYALGRRTYIVSNTVDYIMKYIDGMTDHCRNVLIDDIENPLCNSYGDMCDKVEWMKLLAQLKNEVVTWEDDDGFIRECHPTEKEN